MIPLYDDNPAHRRPLVTVVLIGTCCLVFLWQVSLDPRAQQAAAYSFGFVPAVVLGERSLPVELAVVPAWTTLVTSMFLHGGLLHLAGNMLYLWMFGNNIEDAWALAASCCSICSAAWPPRPRTRSPTRARWCR